MLPYAATSVLSYFLGIIHPSYYFCRRLKNIDIREHGSKNAGTSNATIVLGWKYGVLTALIDVLKGMFAVYFAIWFFGSDASGGLRFWAALVAILGHMFPFYMGFRGGKGLATLMGAIAALNFWLALSLFGVLIVVTFVSDYIVIGTAFVCFGFLGYTFVKYGFTLPTLFAFITVFAILFKHRVNFKRIVNKEEIRFSSTLKKKDKVSDGKSC